MSKTAATKKLPSDFLPSFPAYYDTGRKFYWIENDRNGWIEITETSLRRHLRAAGISPNCPDGEIMSPLDSKLNELQTKFDVAYAGPLAGHRKGVYEISGNRILVSSSPKIIAAKDGSWPLIGSLLKNMFDDPLGDQRPYIIGWLKVARDALRVQQHRPGQALAFAGPRDSGKSLFQNLITEVLGGRVAKPYRYMRDATDFNGELFGAEHLMIEDEVTSTDIRTRRSFGARIKEITVNKMQSFHAKNRQAITLPPFWRLTISLNEEPENLLILPPIDESLVDKINLIKVHKRPMPMPTHTDAQKAAFWNALIAELPAFMWHLDQWEIPAELKCERFGIIHYHHPELLEAIERLAPETRLLVLIDAELFSGSSGFTGQDIRIWLPRQLRKLPLQRVNRGLVASAGVVQQLLGGQAARQRLRQASDQIKLHQPPETRPDIRHKPVQPRLVLFDKHVFAERSDARSEEKRTRLHRPGVDAASGCQAGILSCPRRPFTPLKEQPRRRESSATGSAESSCQNRQPQKRQKA